jgi:transcriptional regulator with XRE-family HTH domain
MPVSGPTVVRRQLGRRLQRLREAAGKTTVDVETARIASRTKVWRIERGQVPVKVPDVWALCRFYNVDQAETDALAALAVGTSEHGWWENYSDVIPEWFKLYVGLEAAAARIYTFEDSVMPGEIQTAAYARAIFRAAQPDTDEETIDRYVNLRLQRQESLFARSPAPKISIVVGQNVVARQVGGGKVLKEQVRHIRSLDQRDNVDIRILTFEAGAHPAMVGAFRIFEFDDVEDPDVVYVEMLFGARYMEKPSELEAYRDIFTMAYQQATPMKDFHP